MHSIITVSRPHNLRVNSNGSLGPQYRSQLYSAMIMISRSIWNQVGIPIWKQWTSKVWWKRWNFRKQKRLMIFLFKYLNKVLQHNLKKKFVIFTLMRIFERGAKQKCFNFSWKNRKLISFLKFKVHGKAKKDYTPYSTFSRCRIEIYREIKEASSLKERELEVILTDLHS